jgi:hypothetical protein
MTKLSPTLLAHVRLALVDTSWTQLLAAVGAIAREELREGGYEPDARSMLCDISAAMQNLVHGDEAAPIRWTVNQPLPLED